MNTFPGKAKYALITAIPMRFVGVTTVTAGILSIRNIFRPLTWRPAARPSLRPAGHSQRNHQDGLWLTGSAVNGPERSSRGAR